MLSVKAGLFRHWPSTKANSLVMSQGWGLEYAQLPYPRRPRLSRALSAHARGAVLKSADWEEFRKAIATVAAGQRYVSSEIEQIVSENPPVPVLSPRQQEILNLMAKGMMNEDIASILKISRPVVKEHVKAILHKLNAANRTEAVAIALRKYIIEP